MIPDRFVLTPVGTVQPACKRCNGPRVTADVRASDRQVVFCCPRCGHAYSFRTVVKAA